MTAAVRVDEKKRLGRRPLGKLRMQIKIPPEIDRLIRELAVREEMSFGEVIAKALNENTGNRSGNRRRVRGH